MDNSQLYTMLEEQESLLQFSEFTNEAALKIGLLLVERARKNGKSIVIDIERYNQKLFHYAFDGTSPNNDYWIEGKKRLVNRFYHSSLYSALKIREGSMPSYSELGIYISGGAFPIILKNSGIIGTIAVSGLPEEDDHGYIVDALKEYLGK